VKATAICLLAALVAGACGSRTGEPKQPPPPPPQQPANAGVPDAAPVDRVMALVAELDRKLGVLRAQMAKYPADITDVEWVKKKLANLVEIDQLARNTVMAPPRDFSKGELLQFQQALVARLLQIDRASTRVLKGMMLKHGWITIDKFGKRASNDAWLLAQHADHDVAFQKRVLAVMKPLADKSKVSPASYAYLYDRVATAEGRPQRYGTQGKCVGPQRWEPHTLEDPVNVDQRRAEVGLPPMAEYKRRFKDICR
jgi:hypothetical protein